MGIASCWQHRPRWRMHLCVHYLFAVHLPPHINVKALRLAVAKAVIRPLYVRNARPPS